MSVLERSILHLKKNKKKKHYLSPTRMENERKERKCECEMVNCKKM